MAKDSQLDPKPIRKMKAKGGHTMAESALDGESRNNKKQSGLAVINAAMISKKSGAFLSAPCFCMT